MESYPFSGQKYMTKGIQEDLPAVLVMYLWKIIEKMKEKDIPMDYLQVFTLSSEIRTTGKLSPSPIVKKYHPIGRTISSTIMPRPLEKSMSSIVVNM